MLINLLAQQTIQHARPHKAAMPITDCYQLRNDCLNLDRNQLCPRTSEKTEYWRRATDVHLRFEIEKHDTGRSPTWCERKDNHETHHAYGGY